MIWTFHTRFNYCSAFIVELYIIIPSLAETTAAAASDNVVTSESSRTTTSGSNHTTTTIRIKPGSSFIPIQEIAKSSTINVTQEQVHVY